MIVHGPWPNLVQKVKGGEQSICGNCFYSDVCHGMLNQPTISCSKFTQRQRIGFVVFGRWVKDDLTNLLYCTHCRADAPLDTTGPSQYQSNFCPNCGADMRGGVGNA